jgi:hypothetical protein
MAKVIKLDKNVQRVVRIEKETDGDVRAVTLYRKKDGKRKKGTKTFRPLEKAVRRLARAHESSAGTYIARHRRSNDKKKDGWLKDAISNVARAHENAARKLRVWPLY